MALTKHECFAVRETIKRDKEGAANKLGCSVESLERLGRGGHDAALERKVRSLLWKEVLHAFTPEVKEVK